MKDEQMDKRGNKQTKTKHKTTKTKQINKTNRQASKHNVIRDHKANKQPTNPLSDQDDYQLN